jgi:RNA polymerase sigma-70 factor (ECF subfamily)
LTGLDPALVRTLEERARADRWRLASGQFEAALLRSAAKAFPGRTTGGPDVDKYLAALHLEDLALACACEHGGEAAWEHFVRELRPALYRAASAIDPTAGRELADGLYGDLFGLKERDGERQSLFRYFHGRSSLLTWLRSVLAQRHIDQVRTGKRVEPLPDEAGVELASPVAAPEPGRDRRVAALLAALAAAIAALAPRDRLRLACYHAQGLTLAQIGRLTAEHEATVSRHLTRTRRVVRDAVEARLRQQGMREAEMAEAFADAVADPGAFAIEGVLSPSAGSERKVSAPGRSR